MKTPARASETREAADGGLRRWGWPFWRKRLARGLVIGAVALLASQFFPHIPQENTLVFVAPEGAHLTGLSVSYFDEAGELLTGIRLRPTEPAGSLANTLDLPDGEVRMELSATVQAGGREQTLLEQRKVHLTGGVQKVFLRAK